MATLSAVRSLLGIEKRPDETALNQPQRLQAEEVQGQLTPLIEAVHRQPHAWLRKASDKSTHRQKATFDGAMELSSGAENKIAAVPTVKRSGPVVRFKTHERLSEVPAVELAAAQAALNSRTASIEKLQSGPDEDIKQRVQPAATAAAPQAAGSKSRSSSPGVRLYESAVTRMQKLRERASSARSVLHEQQSAECSFIPQLVSKLPWPMPQRRATDRRMLPGERLYTEAIEAKRKRELWALQVQQDEDEKQRQKAPKARPVSPAVLGHIVGEGKPAAAPKRKDEPFSFRPKVNPRRPCSAPCRRSRPFVTDSAVPGSLASNPAGGRLARPATPPRSWNLPELRSARKMQPKTSPAWGPPPRRAGLEAAGRGIPMTAADDELWQTARSHFSDMLPASQPELTVDLNFEEFIARQRAFLQAKNAKAAIQRARSGRAESPRLSRGTLRLFCSPGETKGPREVAAEMRHTWQRKHASLRQDHTFQPWLTPRGQQHVARPCEDRSEGDRLRLAFHKERMRLEKILREEMDTPFRPKINKFPGARASSQIRFPETCGDVVQLRQQQHVEHMKAEALRTEAEEQVECTFSPKITRRVPSFLMQIRKQQQSSVSERTPSTRP